MLKWLFRNVVTPVPVIKNRNRRGYDRDYRRPGDEKHVIRVNQKPPKDFPKRLHDWVPVAGVSYRQADVIRFIKGKQRRLTLEHDPNVPGHPDAIRVVGHWLEKGKVRSSHLGYVPSELRKSIVNKLRKNPPEIGVRVEVMFAPRRGKSAGVRMSIWGKAKRRKK